MTILTVKEAGEKLRLHPSTVLKLFDAGVLPGIVLTKGMRKRVVRFRLEAVEEFLASQERGGSDATHSSC